MYFMHSSALMSVAIKSACLCNHCATNVQAGGTDRGRGEGKQAGFKSLEKKKRYETPV